MRRGRELSTGTSTPSVCGNCQESRQLMNCFGGDMASCPVEQRPASASAAEGVSDERAASAELAAGGGGTGRRQRLGEADATGGAEHKKPLSLCPHQRERSLCKECGGASICPHQCKRSTCKECGRASICPHQRQRSRCKECGGAGICPHQRMQGVRGRLHLRPPPSEEHVQGLQATQGLAAGSQMRSDSLRACARAYSRVKV